MITRFAPSMAANCPCRSFAANCSGGQYRVRLRAGAAIRGPGSALQACKDRGLVVLGVPANDFKQQEPCFPLTSKEHVVGDATHPFFRWVLEELGQDAAPRWNFHKYLVGRNGVVANAFGSRTVPMRRKSFLPLSER